MLSEIASGLRAALGPHYPVLCKLGTVDGRDNSLALEESVATAEALQEAGVDAIEVSCTFSGGHARAAAEDVDVPAKEAYFAPQAQVIRQSVDIPVILVDGLRSRDVMQSVVDRSVSDMVSMSRPFICEPDLVNSMETGRVDSSSCISCNRCFNPDGFPCVHVTATDGQ